MTKDTIQTKKFDADFYRFRGECCNILAALFCEPEDGIHNNSDVYKSLFSFSEKTNAKISGYAAKLGTTAVDINIQELSVEYTRLFLGPFGARAYPYSSMYSNERLLMGESSLWVIDFYRNAGFKIDEGIFEPPDHIVIELQFLYMLSFFAANADKGIDDYNPELNYRELFCDFIGNHMLNWVPEFCHQILSNTNSSYYSQLASCLRALIVDCSEEGH